jgi:16S rRNA (guanine(966)-N(2))-methyltransferase RsmD
MRIITGKARGLKLFTPKDYRVRPTADRVKEALFNIIAGYLPDAQILDAFAGTGNLGLEAWSRGAKKVYFVDASNDSLQLVRANVAKARAEAQVKIVKGTTPGEFARLAHQGIKFDIVFSDPPYDKGLNQALYEGLVKTKILKSGGLLVLEHSLNENPTDYVAPDLQIRTEKYGDTKISLIVWK